MYKEYSFPLELFVKLKQSLKYNYSQDFDDYSNFVDELPHNLKIEVSLYLHEETYKKMKFLQDKSMSYIAWICPLLKPYYLQNDEYLYFEGDEIISIFFLKTGNCGFVLPKFENVKYINIEPGNNFGIEDIVGSIIKNEDID